MVAFEHGPTASPWPRLYRARAKYPLPFGHQEPAMAEGGEVAERPTTGAVGPGVLAGIRQILRAGSVVMIAAVSPSTASSWADFLDGLGPGAAAIVILLSAVYFAWRFVALPFLNWLTADEAAWYKRGRESKD